MIDQPAHDIREEATALLSERRDPVSNGAELAPQIFVEPWSSDYGSPMQIDSDQEAANKSELIEEEGFSFVQPANLERFPVAFIDGVRRQECWLSQYREGRSIPGITGSYATGAVLSHANEPPTYGDERMERVVIWSSGLTGPLPPISGGWSWRTVSTAESGPIAPMHKLQQLMQRAESDLAASLAEQGYLVVLDGTLWYALHHDTMNIAGYIKTHHVRLLPEVEAARLPSLPTGYRTTLFRTDPGRYACYLRLTDRGPYAPPMAGIVRLEFSGSLPLGDARALADRFCSFLPMYAGVAHADPRAPQNLQPIGALEKRLRHLLGDPRLAERAARDAVAALKMAGVPHAT